MCKKCKKPGDSVWRPHFFCDSVFTIPYDFLYAKGIRGLIFDIDNTLAGYDDPTPPERILDLYADLQTRGFKVGLLSNNNDERLRVFNQATGLPGYARACKPAAFALTRLLRDLALPRRETALVGDQLFTDVWCARRAGLCSVLVKPLTDKDVWLVRAKRRLEQRVLRRWTAGHTIEQKTLTPGTCGFLRD